MSENKSKLSVHAGSLILVNADHPCRTECTDLVPVSAQTPSCQMKTEAAGMLSGLLEAIEGYRTIIPVSGWRSRREQTEIWDNSIAESGIDFTKKYVALPGCSEHQTGLAIDLALRSEHVDFIRPYFPHDGVCEAFRQRMTEFGYIERYPNGKETITGISYEPWHFRYVGVPHAAVMTEHGWTLEEYIDLLRCYLYFGKGFRTSWRGAEYRISFVPEAERNILFELQIQKNIFISGNNTDGFIVTEQVAL